MSRRFASSSGEPYSLSIRMTPVSFVIRWTSPLRNVATSMILSPGKKMCAMRKRRPMIRQFLKIFFSREGLASVQMS